MPDHDSCLWLPLPQEMLQTPWLARGTSTSHQVRLIGQFCLLLTCQQLLISWVVNEAMWHVCQWCVSFVIPTCALAYSFSLVLVQTGQPSFALSGVSPSSFLCAEVEQQMLCCVVFIFHSLYPAAFHWKNSTPSFNCYLARKVVVVKVPVIPVTCMYFCLN